MSYESPLVTYLEALHHTDVRGALADLRRGLGKPPGTVPAMYPHVARFVPQQDSEYGRDSPYYTVASLFAYHPQSLEGVSMGMAYSQLPDSRTRDLRFRALVSADADRIHDHLRHAVSLLRSENIGIDYRQLLYHLKQWGSFNRWVQRKWSQHFWGAWASSAIEGNEEGTPDVR